MEYHIDQRSYLQLTTKISSTILTQWECVVHLSILPILTLSEHRQASEQLMRHNSMEQLINSLKIGLCTNS